MVTSSSALALKTSGALRQLEARAAAQAEGARGGGGGSAARIARLQASCSRRRYAEALADHHALLAALRDDHEHLLRRQIKLRECTRRRVAVSFASPGGVD